MILDTIVEKIKERVIEAKKQKSLLEIKKEVEKLPVNIDFPFEKALKKEGVSFILEVKKASPSKGDIVDSFDYLTIAKEYESIGASAISVLTEPYFFKGNNRYLQEIAQTVAVPLLRKDFIVDEYMIYEAKLFGASAILLICSVLKEEEMKKYLTLAHALGLSCLVETHDEQEIAMALSIGARIIGVNNRNLKDFSVDITNSVRKRELVPKDIIFVSESGITSNADIKVLEQNHIDAVLIGETIMKSQNKQEMLHQLQGKE
ncbi:MAG: indole-3-glycerol phosphate synthase TrpC [Coprobacillaceae bacterium]